MSKTINPVTWEDKWLNALSRLYGKNPDIARLISLVQSLDAERIERDGQDADDVADLQEIVGHGLGILPALREMRSFIEKIAYADYRGNSGGNERIEANALLKRLGITREEYK